MDGRHHHFLTSYYSAFRFHTAFYNNYMTTTKDVVFPYGVLCGRIFLRVLGGGSLEVVHWRWFGSHLFHRLYIPALCFMYHVSLGGHLRSSFIHHLFCCSVAFIISLAAALTFIFFEKDVVTQRTLLHKGRRHTGAICHINLLMDAWVCCWLKALWHVSYWLRSIGGKAWVQRIGIGWTFALYLL